MRESKIMLNAFSKELIKKYNVNIKNRNFEVRIYDNYFGIRGFFLVKIWEGKKFFLQPPDIYFDTRENPISLVNNAISGYIGREEKYEETLNKIAELEGE